MKKAAEKADGRFPMVQPAGSHRLTLVRRERRRRRDWCRNEGIEHVVCSGGESKPQTSRRQGSSVEDGG